MNILILCTGNSCRSQMAEGFLKTLDSGLNVQSAGTRPEKSINPYAVEVMAEKGIDISANYPKNADVFAGQDFDFVITVCDNARESCPVFTGNVKNRLHIGFDDPAAFRGGREETLNEYRRIRDQIFTEFTLFYNNYLKV